MKILILEDEATKMELIQAEIIAIDPLIEINTSITFQSFLKQIERDKFDLIIVDLLVPRFNETDESVDVTDQIIDATRDHDCCNFRTPVVAITRFDTAAEDNFKNLNLKDISVITFSEDKQDWRETLKQKIVSCMPPITYDFVIFCALHKESNGFLEAGYNLGITRAIHGLDCREIKIGEMSGVIITSPRMGLVSSAITTSRAIELFRPKLICMSGICAGIDEKAQIYDVVIPDMCHQHDSGKWGSNGFELESYAVQITHEMRLKIKTILEQPDFIEAIRNNVKLLRKEIPENKQELEFGVLMAPASSGSAVIADEAMNELIRQQHRKMTAFEMESFAVYESARLSITQPKYFSAKAVVDDGVIKSDEYHRVACILSAKVVHELIRRGVGD